MGPLNEDSLGVIGTGSRAIHPVTFKRKDGEHNENEDWNLYRYSIYLTSVQPYR